MSYDELKLENQLCFPLYACAKNVVRMYTPHLEKLGLTYTQYITMMVLWEHEEMNVKNIGKKLYLDSGTLTPLLKKLEKIGLVERRRSDRDERTVVIALTQKGRLLEQQAREIPAKVGSCLELTQEEAGTLYQILHKLMK